MGYERLTLILELIWEGYERFVTDKVVAVLTIVVLILVLIWLVYKRLANGRWPEWTGFGEYIGPRVPQNKTFQPGKTLWDWMQLLIIPAILAGGVYWLNESARQSEQAISSDNIQEAALQTYIDRMAELLIKENLSESEQKSEVRVVARARTLTVLQGLDKERKGALLRFLYEANLIQKDKTVIDLSGANLREANLRWAQLREAYLYRANLDGADLRWAQLSFANLSGASLNEAKLYSADLRWAQLSEASLYEADLNFANLSGADLSGANLIKAELRYDLNGANLSGARLIDAHLSGVRLINANLSRADLLNADLRVAQLIDANLSGAYLNNADLRGAQLRGANLRQAQLRGAKYTKNIKYPLLGTIWPEGFDPDAAGAIRVDE